MWLIFGDCSSRPGVPIETAVLNPCQSRSPYGGDEREAVAQIFNVAEGVYRNVELFLPRIIKRRIIQGAINKSVSMVIPSRSGAHDSVIRLSILCSRLKGVWHVEE